MPRQTSARRFPVPVDLSSLCLDGAPLPIAWTDGPAHVLRYANAAFCLLTARSLIELTGRAFGDIFPAQGECLALLDRIYLTAQPESYTEQDHAGAHPAFPSCTGWPVLASGQAVGVMIHVAETASLYEKTLVMNEALVLGALRQHELAEAGDVSNTAREAAEDALRHANEVLEARVAERTQALTEANSRLQVEAEERERVEEALRQSQKMEAVGQLTGGIAHDFNNLLQGIIGSLELVRNRVGQGRTDDLTRYIDVAMTSAERAATLTHRLLAFSRRQTLDPKPTDVNVLAGGMMELFGRTVGPGIVIALRLADHPWATLCDSNQLESALLNLVINARDAMPRGGHLVIDTANISLSDRRGRAKDPLSSDVPAGDYVTLSVIDDGAGMSPRVASRAFDPFFTTKPIGQGTGLGLSMIDGFVQQTGGHVRLSSQEGHGTAVRIYLPRHHEAPAARPVTNASPADLASPKASAAVLVVEDEPGVRMIVVEVLSELGYTMIEAADGRSGLRILDAGTPVDLLLTDVGLPGGMNGRQLADAARQRRPGLKVLFITGYADSVAVGNGRMEQGMQVMIKPFVVNALATRIHDMVSNGVDG